MHLPKQSLTAHICGRHTLRSCSWSNEVEEANLRYVHDQLLLIASRVDPVSTRCRDRILPTNIPGYGSLPLGFSNLSISEFRCRCGMKMQGGRISFRAQYRSLANSSVHRHITAGIQAVFDAPEDTAASFRQRIHVKLCSLSAVVTQQGRTRQVLLDPATVQAPPHTQLRKNASPTFHRHRPHICTSQLSFAILRVTSSDSGEHGDGSARPADRPDLRFCPASLAETKGRLLLPIPLRLYVTTGRR